MSKRPTSRSLRPFLPGANNGHCPGRPVDPYDRRFNGSDTLQAHLDDQREAEAQTDFHQAMGHRLDRNGYLRERWLAPDEPLSAPEATESETDIAEDEAETTESETDSDCSWNSEEDETDQEPESDEEQPSPRPGEACPGGQPSPRQEVPCQTCRGCREGLANQQAHMDFGGCLAD